MKFLSKKAPKPKDNNLFQIKKVHRPKLRFLRIVEIVLIVIVAAGTLVAFVNYRKISFQNLFSEIVKTALPKQSSKSATKEASFEEELKVSLQKNSIKIVSLATTAEGNLQAVVGEEINVFFNEKADPTEQVTTLQTVLAKAKIEDKKVKKVDFRFGNLVVEY